MYQKSFFQFYLSISVCIGCHESVTNEQGVTPPKVDSSASTAQIGETLKEYSLYHVWSSAKVVKLRNENKFMEAIFRKRDIAFSKVDSITLIPQRQPDGEYYEWIVPKGEMDESTLADGTVFTLNADSKLQFSANMDLNRQIKLLGECRLKVYKRKTPLIIQAENAVIKINSGLVNIMNYSNEPEFYLAVAKGSASIITQTDSLLLMSGEYAKWPRGADKITVARSDPSRFVDWPTGFISVDDYCCAAFCNKLSRWYNITIEYIGDSNKCPLTGKIPSTAKLSDIIKIFKLNDIKIKYIIRNNNLVMQIR